MRIRIGTLLELLFVKRMSKALRTSRVMLSFDVVEVGLLSFFHNPLLFGE